MIRQIQGVIPVVHTPFLENGELDRASLVRELEWHVLWISMDCVPVWFPNFFVLMMLNERYYTSGLVNLTVETVRL